MRAENRDKKRRFQAALDVPGAAGSAVDEARKMIGERVHRSSPTARVETPPFPPEFLAGGDEPPLAGHERENARMDLRLDDEPLSTGCRRREEGALPALEGRFDGPPPAIERADAGGGDPVHREGRGADAMLSRLLGANRGKAATSTIGGLNAGMDRPAEVSQEQRPEELRGVDPAPAFHEPGFPSRARKALGADEVFLVQTIPDKLLAGHSFHYSFCSY
ncbi:MAG: hypothetical protein GYA73_14175 [Planctomycetes bacterium]|nr:hypothetical protein [Planctomycetota bacterium]